MQIERFSHESFTVIRSACKSVVCTPCLVITVVSSQSLDTVLFAFEVFMSFDFIHVAVPHK